MRDIADNEGRRWTAAVGRESYGMQVVLFVPVGGGGAGDVRKAMLASDTRLDAQREFDALADDDLIDMLARSVPWESEDITGG